MEAQRDKKKVHFVSLVDMCHLKNSELGPTLQKYKGRVVLRDIVKDGVGAYEQGSSASQMTAAKIMDVIARLPGCDGHTADSVSAFIQVKLEDAPRLLKIAKSQCLDVWIRLLRHEWQKSWKKFEDSVLLFERNLHDHPLARLLWERCFEQALLKLGRDKIPDWECMFVHRKKNWKEADFGSNVEDVDKKCGY